MNGSFIVELKAKTHWTFYIQILLQHFFKISFEVQCNSKKPFRFFYFSSLSTFVLRIDLLASLFVLVIIKSANRIVPGLLSLGPHFIFNLGSHLERCRHRKSREKKKGKISNREKKRDKRENFNKNQEYFGFVRAVVKEAKRIPNRSHTA